MNNEFQIFRHIVFVFFFVFYYYILHAATSAALKTQKKMRKLSVFCIYVGQTCFQICIKHFICYELLLLSFSYKFDVKENEGRNLNHLWILCILNAGILDAKLYVWLIIVHNFLLWELIEQKDLLQHHHSMYEMSFKFSIRVLRFVVKA